MKKYAGFYSAILILPLFIFLLISCSSEKPDYIDRMSAEHKDDSPVANASADKEISDPVVTESVTYANIDGQEITGYLAKPEGGDSNLPGIIVIHEWWGLNDNIKMMTRRLASLGYKALAVDLYHGKSAETPENAGKYAREVGENPELATDNLKQAYAYLELQEDVGKTGVLGWCFGGAWSLNTALAMPEKIDAVVIYYGRLVTDPDRLEKLDMPILGLFGAEDRGIPVESVREFESVLDDLGKDATIHIYEGANHAFANPSGTRYNEEAAEKAWAETTEFLNEHLSY